jgi:hypothetical protein
VRYLAAAVLVLAVLAAASFMPAAEPAAKSAADAFFAAPAAVPAAPAKPAAAKADQPVTTKDLAVAVCAAADDESFGYEYDFATGILYPHFNETVLTAGQNGLPGNYQEVKARMKVGFKKTTEPRAARLLAWFKTTVNPDAKLDWSKW